MVHCLPLLFFTFCCIAQNIKVKGKVILKICLLFFLQFLGFTKTWDGDEKDENYTAQKMKFSIKDFFSKCDQIPDFTFTEEILNGKLHFLCSVKTKLHQLTYFIPLVSFYAPWKHMKARGFLMSLEAIERKKCWMSTHPENCCRRPENVPKFCVYTVSLQTCLSTKYIDVTICKLIQQWHMSISCFLFNIFLPVFQTCWK